MKNRRVLYLLLTMAGLLLLLAAIFLFPGDASKQAAGACYGVGASAFILGIGWFASTFSKILNSEAAKKKKVIATADERNICIREKAAAQVEKCTTYALILWIILEGFLGGSILPIILPIALLALRFAFLIFFTNHYEKTI